MNEQRFYPSGCIGTFQAILALAKSKHPEHWKSDTITPKEEVLWLSINVTRNGLLIWDFLANEIGWKTSGTIDRWCDFLESKQELQKMLYGGGLTAKFIENDGQMNVIKAHSWGVADVDEVFLTGIAVLADGNSYVVLIEEAELEKRFALNRSAEGASLRPPSQASLREWYKTWLATLSPQHVPTLREVEQSAKAWNARVTRQQARDLRSQSHPDADRPGPRGRRSQ